MKQKTNAAWLGIDTSLYTCSIALIFDDDDIIFRKDVLPVKPNVKSSGIRQSAALIKHIKILPDLLGELGEVYDLTRLRGIGVSAIPRPILNSYKIVFEGGKNIAHIIGNVLNIPVIELSHQENHIEAIVVGTDLNLEELDKPFLAIHFSGNTSEILRAKRTDRGYYTERVAGSLDSNSGQLIDRIGVKLGLHFPAGSELEKIALQAKDKNIIISSHNRKVDFHFTGQENHIVNLLDKGYPKEEVLYGMFKMIGKSLNEAILKLGDEEDFDTILFSGGVMSNSIIREELIDALEPVGLKLYFAPSEYSSDNAIGNASLARRILQNG